MPKVVRVYPKVKPGPNAFVKQSKVDKNIRILNYGEEPYRINGDWVRLPREVMDALEYEGVSDRYVRAREFAVDFAVLDTPEFIEMMKEV